VFVTLSKCYISMVSFLVSQDCFVITCCILPYRNQPHLIKNCFSLVHKIHLFQRKEFLEHPTVESNEIAYLITVQSGPAQAFEM